MNMLKTSDSTNVGTERIARAEALVRSVRTGEISAARHLGSLLADDVVLDSTRGPAKGREEVLRRLSGQWALTPTLARAVWTRPVDDGTAVVVSATFPGLGAAPRRLEISISFDHAGAVSRVGETWQFDPAPQPVHVLPDHVTSAIDRALAANTPIMLCYVDEHGAPRPSLRGSVQVSGPLELSIWVRKATGGLVHAIESNDRVALLYRDSATRTTFTIAGRARLSTDEAIRDAVFARSPEVEQQHDPQRRGAAVLVDIDEVQGTSPFGAVLVARPETEAAR
jgi:general stress protein 26